MTTLYFLEHLPHYTLKFLLKINLWIIFSHFLTFFLNFPPACHGKVFYLLYLFSSAKMGLQVPCVPHCDVLTSWLMLTGTARKWIQPVVPPVTKLQQGGGLWGGLGSPITFCCVRGRDTHDFIIF